LKLDQLIKTVFAKRFFVKAHKKIPKELLTLRTFRRIDFESKLLSKKPHHPEFNKIISKSFFDQRTVSFNVPAQEILTNDSVTVEVDAVVFYRVSHPMSAVCNVANFSASTKRLAATTLR
jgi:hypothetical protein